MFEMFVGTVLCRHKQLVIDINWCKQTWSWQH